MAYTSRESTPRKLFQDLQISGNGKSLRGSAGSGEKYIEYKPLLGGITGAGAVVVRFVMKGWASHCYSLAVLDGKLDLKREQPRRTENTTGDSYCTWFTLTK